MRLSFFQGRLLLGVCSCVAAFMLSGCMMTPDIANKDWKYIRVVYLERDVDDKLKPNSWHSKDKDVLQRLRAAFPSGGEYVPCYKPASSKTHRVDIKTRWCQWWSLRYMPRYQSPPMIRVYDESRRNPFCLYYEFDLHYAFDFEHENQKAFFVTLTNEIMRVSGTAVDFDMKFRPGELDALGTNNAAWYEQKYPCFP